ncbi:MAG: hypothetical protein IJ506_06275 [Clostridia bacterium]|nr:hypothetical protein [Clostridia bacterium]
MAEVKLFKQISHYEKDGETKTATNFFVQCGDTNIPIEIKYFENKQTGKDTQYLGRKMVLSSYAEEIPAKEKDEKDKKDNPKTDNKA